LFERGDYQVFILKEQIHQASGEMVALLATIQKLGFFYVKNNMHGFCRYPIKFLLLIFYCDFMNTYSNIFSRKESKGANFNNKMAYKIA
jgi:hypothetical protein